MTMEDLELPKWLEEIKESLFKPRSLRRVCLPHVCPFLSEHTFKDSALQNLSPAEFEPNFVIADSEEPQVDAMEEGSTLTALLTARHPEILTNPSSSNALMAYMLPFLHLPFQNRVPVGIRFQK